MMWVNYNTLQLYTIVHAVFFLNCMDLDLKALFGMGQRIRYKVFFFVFCSTRSTKIDTLPTCELHDTVFVCEKYMGCMGWMVSMRVKVKNDKFIKWKECLALIKSNDRKHFPKNLSVTFDCELMKVSIWLSVQCYILSKTRWHFT